MTGEEVDVIGPRRTMAVLTLTIVLLGLVDVSRSVWVPSGAHFALNVGVALALLGMAAAADATTGELGLRGADVGSGLRWGGGAFVVIAASLLVFGLLAPGSSLLADDRADIGLGSLLVRALVVIPLGTVLLEELAFRGLLLALLQRVTSSTRAVLGASLLFGLWHIPVAWNSSTTARMLSVGGTVVATTVAGLGFCWLRLRSRSIVAPVLAHLATNSVALTVAWMVGRRT